MNYIKVIVLAVYLLVSQSIKAIELPLTPLSKQYIISEEAEKSIAFSTLSSDLSIFVTGGANNLELVFQGGTPIDLTKNSQLCTISKHVDELLKSYSSVVCKKLQIGLYQLRFFNPANSEVSIAIVEDNFKYALISKENISLELGELTAQSIALFAEGVALKNATVNLKIQNEQDEIVFDEVMQDNGELPDAKGGDGIYSVLFKPEIEGEYKTLFNIKSNGAEYEVKNYFIVSSKAASLTGQFRVEGIDTNNDSEFDSYDFIFDYINNNTSLNYEGYVVIIDSNGNKITSETKNPKDSEIIKVNFSADKILKLQNKPWMLKTVLITVGSTEYIDALHDLGPIDIDTDNIKKKNIEFLGVTGHRGIDKDNDGKFDELAVDVQFSTRYPGQYSLTGTLRNTDNQMISKASITDVQLVSSAKNTFTLYFSGADIVNSGYVDDINLWDISLVPDFTPPVYLTIYIPDNIASLSSYTCNDFAVCELSIEDQIRHGASLLCDKQKSNILEKLDKITAKDKKNKKPQQKQLEALLHRVSVISRSRACSNESVKTDFLSPSDFPSNKGKKG